MDLAPDRRETFIPHIRGSILATLDSGSGTLATTRHLTRGDNPTTITTSAAFLYTGQRFDPETAGSTAQPSGLYDYRVRMHSSTLERLGSVPQSVM